MTTHVQSEDTMHPSLQVLARLQRERDLYAAGLSEMTVRYEEKIQELSLLRRTLDVLRDCTDLEEVFRRLLTIVQEEMATVGCSLYLADDCGDLVLRARCLADDRVESLRPRHPESCRVPAGRGPLGETFVTGRVQVVAEVPAGSPGWYPAGAPVLLTAPLGPATACMGVLALHDRELETVSRDAPRLLPILASQATIAIENVALYQRLKQHTETLEVRVRERTAALEHLNGELKAAAQQKAQFFAHFSHEIRTPLNSILGFSEMLRTDTSGPLTERQRRFVQHVHDSGSRLLRLINDILDLAKVEAGKLSLQVVPTSLRRVVEQAAGAMQPQAQSKQVRLLAAVPDGLPSVSADPARIHQVLLNLLSNAIKFTAEGGSVDVTAVLVARADGDAAADPQPVVEISVRDTGVGIAPADQARLFRDFEQVADGAGQGTGLGLSLTRRLVALHGGQVGIESVLGEGSRFWFTLPVAAPGAEVAAEAIRHGR